MLSFQTELRSTICNTQVKSNPQKQVCRLPPSEFRISCQVAESMVRNAGSCDRRANAERRPYATPSIRSD